MKRLRLLELAHARSGDKADWVDFGKDNYAAIGVVYALLGTIIVLYAYRIAALLSPHRWVPPLLGTFLVRSGVLVSVHAFATDPSRGLFILMFLLLCIGGALGLYAWRAPRFRSEAGFSMLSREAFLLVNNVLLVAATGLILIGTLYPLVIDTLGLGKISGGGISLALSPLVYTGREGRG